MLAVLLLNSTVKNMELFELLTAVTTVFCFLAAPFQTLQCQILLNIVYTRSRYVQFVRL